MVRNKAFKFRIYPNKEQEALLQQSFGAVRYVYNMYLSKRIDHYETTGKGLSYNQTASMLVSQKMVDTFLTNVDSIALQQSLRHLDEAFSNFFKKKSQYPNFKSKKKCKKTYTTININNSVRFEGNSVKLPKLGYVKVVQHRNIPNDYKLKSVTVSQTRTEKYFISVLFEYDNQVVECTDKNKSVGLDFSMSELYVDDKGNTPKMPHFYRQAEKRLAKAQRKLSKMFVNNAKEQSNRYYKQKRRVAVLSEKVSNQRKDFLHKLSRNLIDKYDYICIEDLDVKEMSQNATYHLGKSVHDNGWHMFTNMLTYKADMYGKHVIKINRYYPSSQICHVCGTIDGPKPLNVRKWVCSSCGTLLDRDINAAINIKKQGLSMA